MDVLADPLDLGLLDLVSGWDESDVPEADRLAGELSDAQAQADACGGNCEPYHSHVPGSGVVAPHSAGLAARQR